MKSLYVLYDPDCGFCTRCRAWLACEPAYVTFEFVPTGTPRLGERFPGLDPADVRAELTVVSDRGEVYRGTKAWLVCLWALKRYRSWARRLASPALLPLAREAFQYVSRNREGLSRLLGLRSEEEVRRELSVETARARACPAPSASRSTAPAASPAASPATSAPAAPSASAPASAPAAPAPSWPSPWARRPGP